MKVPIIGYSLAILIAACAGPPPASWPPTGEGHEVAVTVDNDLTRRSDVVVRMVSNAGSSILGGIPPGEERSFAYRSGMLAGSFTLSATTGDGRTLRSRAFTLFPGAYVTWSIQLNDLRVTGREDGPTRAPARRIATR